MEWASGAWMGAVQHHWVEEHIVQVVAAEAYTLAAAASVPYSEKTLVGYWEAAYQTDSALAGYTAQACRHPGGQEEASQAS